MIWRMERMEKERGRERDLRIGRRRVERWWVEEVREQERERGGIFEEKEMKTSSPVECGWVGG